MCVCVCVCVCVFVDSSMHAYNACFARVLYTRARAPAYIACSWDGKKPKKDRGACNADENPVGTEKILAVRLMGAAHASRLRDAQGRQFFPATAKVLRGGRFLSHCVSAHANQSI